MSTVPSPVSSRAGQFGLALSEAMWLAILLALPLVMNVTLARSFEAAKLMAVAPMAVLCLAGLAAAWLERAAPQGQSLLRSAPALAFFALIGVAILATLTSETPWIAFFGDYFRREGLASWLLYAILFAAPLALLREREQLERLIDVLLLASVVPCVYAIMQRYGYDFFLTQGLLVGTSAARPGGTMGNPTFLASLLLLIIPVCFARALTAGNKLWQRAPWLLLLALQMYAALLTQSRGPLIGILAMLFVLLLLLGAQARARVLVLGAFAAAGAVVVGLLLINFVPSLAEAVADTPLRRFVFAGGDLTVDSRFGIWQSGVDSFLNAPLWRQLIGYGPDAASFNYFNWMPATAQRIEGYSETIDRLHSELLETLLSFGLIGLLAQLVLFSALVWAVAQRLLPVANAGRARSLPACTGFALLVIAGLAAGAVAGYAAAGRSVAPIGAGAGVAAAWVLFLAWRAWGRIRSTAAAHDEPSRVEALLAAALISGLIGSWVEVQVGVPTIVTRATVAIYAALLILTLRGAWRPVAVEAPAPAPAQPSAPANPRKGNRQATKSAANTKAAASKQAAPQEPRWTPILGWAAALMLAISVADFFPPLSGARMFAPALSSLGLIAWPLLLALVVALLMCMNAAVRGPGGKADLGRYLTQFLLWVVPTLVLFCAIYAHLGGAVDNAAADAIRGRIAALTDFSFTAYALIALALAAALYLGDRAPHRQAASHAGRAGLAALIVGLVLAAGAWQWVRDDYSADVGAKLAGWAQGRGDADAAALYLQEAREIMPRERRFAGSYAARQIESASRDAGKVSEPAVAQVMLGKLKRAEEALVQARALAPRDPWLTFGYANVQQFLGLRMLGAVQPAPERQRHAEEARKYLELARQQFPGHPWILRNWAQLEFDQGNRQAGFARLEEMEALDPLNPGVYTEWVKMARLDNNPAVALAAVRRGLRVLPGDSAGAATLHQELINIPRDAGRLGEAISAALEYTVAQPNRINAWRQLVELYERAGHKEMAQANVDSALARFAETKKDAQATADYAALQELSSRLIYAASGAPKAPPGVPSGPVSAPPPGPSGTGLFRLPGKAPVAPAQGDGQATPARP